MAENLPKTQLLHEVVATTNAELLTKATTSDIITSYNDLTDKPTIPVLADISKAEIEAKLTGEISSHSHAGGGGLTQPQIMARTLGC